MKTALRLFSLAFLALVVTLPAAAGTLPYNIGNVQQYLDSSGYFNGYTELDAIDFSGQWQYTAIAFESGNINTVSTTTEASDSSTFSTANNANFGTWKNINFSSEQLYFEDNDPTDIALDSFSTASNGSFFRVFQLTADSNALDYLGSNLTLALGTIIVGFNDNGLSLGDADYDDIIVALQPIPVPAAAFLFAPALLGFMGLRRRVKSIIA
ncbi:hypothetical protein A9Q79_05835 [Methylophaga sp. 42_25_T18]|nr:hypothetical protein A9Q79_05835 [Methylophaga sp. 42_25_T18]OUR85929.1 hypothetical protein A9Q92_06955 [Methylophaga sp. 42_8_T64]